MLAGRSSEPRPRAVIFDRDGTLASCQREFVDRPKPEQDWGQFNSWLRFDAAVPEVAALFRIMRGIPDLSLHITTGRDGSLRRPMLDWLAKHDLMPDELHMRPAGDRRLDSIVKQEIFERDIQPRFDVQLVIDDRPQVVAMWRSLGLPVIAVSDPGLLPPIAQQRG